jgi:hypothetical protein
VKLTQASIFSLDLRTRAVKSSGGKERRGAEPRDQPGADSRKDVPKRSSLERIMPQVERFCGRATARAVAPPASVVCIIMLFRNADRDVFAFGTFSA